MRKVFFLVFVLFMMSWAHEARAASYYEFNPDYAQSLLVASNETPSEVFLPLNEFLSGFDLWLSNSNQAGNATFTLFNPSGTQLSSQTIALPAIADSDDGTRYHVSLPSQITVTGNAAYRLQITSDMPSLALYYAPQVRLLTYNGTPVTPYSGGLARLGGDDQAYSFKFALYESSEAVPPVLSNVTTGQTTIEHVLLTFNANEPVDYRVQYGQTTLNWTGTYTSCLANIHQCTVSLPVSPGTTYNYTLTVKDSWGNTSGFSGTFISLGYGQTPSPTPVSSAAAVSSAPSPTPTPDRTGPVITNVRLVNPTTHSAAFAWTTNEAANGLVVVQIRPLLISAGGNSDPTLELEHYVNVENLLPDTYYQATIRSSDASGNTSIATVTFLSPRISITPPPTPQPSGSSTPTPSPVIATPGPDDPTGISWNPPATGEPAGGYRVDVFDSNNNLIGSYTVPAGTHRTSLNNIDPGDHRIVVYADDNGVYQKVAPARTVTIRKKPLLERMVASAPYILGGIVLAIALAIGVLKFLKRPKRPSAPVMPTPPPSAGSQYSGV